MNAALLDALVAEVAKTGGDMLPVRADLSQEPGCAAAEARYGQVDVLVNNAGPYGAAKAATEAFTTVMAADLKGTGVTANIIVPGGLTNTALVNDSVPYDRATMLQPEVMVAPLLWLVSDAADGVNSRRYIGARWDTAEPVESAQAAAGAPAAWAALGKQMIPMQR